MTEILVSQIIQNGIAPTVITWILILSNGRVPLEAAAKRSVSRSGVVMVTAIIILLGTEQTEIPLVGEYG